MFDDLKNEIDFYIRNKIKFSRKNFVEKNIENIKTNKLENLYIEAILRDCFKQIKKDNLKILDIGCKNWSYIRGLYSFFSLFSNNFVIDGVEIDPYRLYSNFYSRYETAKYYMSGLGNVNYICDDLLNINETYDYITWFLPFIIEKSHQLWGLPKKYFYPEELLIHAYSLLKQNGQMLIVNQGEKEANIQKEMFEKLNINYLELGEIKQEFFEYKKVRFGFLLIKE